MKLKLLKKLMIICMSFSLSVSMVPASVLAAGKDSSEGDTQAVQVISSDTESESANTETETKHQETKNQETKHHKDKETSRSRVVLSRKVSHRQLLRAKQ
ncbi:MAG: hypothetical protein ACLTTO_15860 [Lachnospiraceae bacterium]